MIKKTAIIFIFFTFLSSALLLGVNFSCLSALLYSKLAFAQPAAAEEAEPAMVGRPIVADGLPKIMDTYTYGNIVISRNLPKSPMAGFIKPVVFPHWWHRTVFVCKVCHTDIGFKMKAGANDIKMIDIQQGKWCGTCHNGKIAFAPVQCPRCHSEGIEVKENRNAREHLIKLPPNNYGNKVDWVKAINEGAITPKTSLDGKGQMAVLDRDIEFKVQGGDDIPLPDVIYPHKQHTQWLFCNNCHPDVFQMKAGGNPVTMLDIFQGKYCGVCHGKVAFPLMDCLRCHNKERLEASYKNATPPANRGK
jgi:c(7)-type cytochrome triheme protein